ncbi:MAG: hypothetical protein AB7K24_34915, partial [Gemmataceae bacterium]
QLLLFNACAGSVNPDYAPCMLHCRRALLAMGVVVTLWLVGLFLLIRDWSSWWQNWLRPRAVIWLAMFAVAAVTLTVIPTQRPRPSYLFALSVFLMAGTGMSAFLILNRLRLQSRLDAILPVMMVAFLLLVPSYYANPEHCSPPLLHTLVERLRPFQPILDSPDTTFLKGEFAGEIENYLGHKKCVTHSYSLLEQWHDPVSLEEFLEQHHVNLFYLDESLMHRLVERHDAATFLGNTGNARWKLIGFEDVAGARWKLFQRVDNVDIQPATLAHFQAAP